MKNLFSTAVIATAFALLVPNNGAEAVGTAVQHSLVSVAEAMPTSVSALPAPAGDNKLAWVMAAGFLGVVISRRLRAE